MTHDPENLMLPEQERRIARYLIENPDADNKKIAADLGLHINTVQPIAKQLKTEILSPSFQILDWDAIGLGLRYRIDIQINQRHLHQGGGP